MSIRRKWRKCRLFKRLFKADLMVKDLVEKRKITQADLDKRLDSIAEATVNGGDEYFLQLVKRNPKCAIDVIKECKLDG